MDAEEQKLWTHYHDGDADAGDALARRFQPMVMRIIHHAQAKLPSEIDRDEINSAAQFGLLDAMQRFDPALGYKFPTFAARRITGQIYDALRKANPNSRLTVEAKRRSDEARRQLAVSGQATTDEAVIAMLGRAAHGPSPFRHRYALEHVLYDADNGRHVTLAELVAHEEREETAEECDARIRTLLAGLSFDCQILLYLYYWKGATMKKIGLVLDLSESRVSQLHSQLVKRLRERGREKMLAAAG